MQFVSHIIETEIYRSLLYFVLGGLFVLFTYHLFRFFSNHSIAYLYYSLYALFSLLAYLSVLENGFIKDLLSDTLVSRLSKEYFTSVYNCLYFMFFCAFLDLKKINRTYYNFILFPVYGVLTLSTALFIVALISGKDGLYFSFVNLFVIFITILTLISFVILIRIKNPLKWYIISGGIILFITSMAGEKNIRDILNISRKTGDFIFFTGFFFENMLFALALGHKHRREFHERETFQSNLIRELKNNESLRKEINRKNEEKLLAENEKIRMQRENSELAMAALRSQINPHFIFNALHSIKLYMLSNDKENAVEYLNKFSRLIRLILSSSFEKESTLLAELEILKLYLDIENLRFSGEMQFSVQVDGQLDTQSVVVPPLFLQPFLENAIWHGISASPEKKIWLEVRAKNNTEIEISIKDSGIGIEKAAVQKSLSVNKGKSFGIRIARDSLKKFYSGRHSILYLDNREQNPESPGTTVVITIPVKR